MAPQAVVLVVWIWRWSQNDRIDVPNPQMRKKYDLPTNEKILKKSQNGCQNDRMDASNPEMRLRYHFGCPKPTNEKKKQFTHK